MVASPWPPPPPPPPPAVASPVTQAFADALRSCGALTGARALHGRLVAVGLASAVFLQNTLLHAYLSCGALSDARRLLLTDVAHPQRHHPQRHAEWDDSDVAAALVDMFVRCGTVDLASSMLVGYVKTYGVDHGLELFDSMPERDVVSWNMMVSALSQSVRVREALDMVVVVDMQSKGWGKQLHAQVIRNLPHIDPYVASALVELYAKCGCFKEAKGVFNSLHDRNNVAWTVLISGFLQYGCFTESVELFNQMRAELMTVDQFALATLISGCCSKMDLCLGRFMNEKDIVSWTSMITAHSQVGNIAKAREFFDGMSTKNVITWNAMLGAYIQHGAEEDGLRMYKVMLSEKDARPDWVTYVTLFKGCADLGANKLGDQIIGRTVKVGLILDTSVANAVITMYSKYGRILEARKIFDFLKVKDIVSWNAMITGYSQHGMGKQAIEIFDDILKRGAKPDYISYVAVLSGCSHSGLVQEGKSYFDMMKRVHNISPDLEHFSCMVDLLGRAGHLTEAKDLIDEMPMKPTAEVWGALLSACKIHGNNELAELAAKHVFELDSPDSGSYMLMAKIYADAGKSDDSAQIRKLMRDKGIKKNPGYSWMEVNNKVHVFKADDVSHPQVIAIRKKLDELMERIARLGYVRTDSPRSEIHHSEKLAVAFGLMSLPAWMPIHIMKNLRICGDCHTVIKLISSVTGREFVIRDAVRFHHFNGGSCSCGHYW
ncbi:pentatricopeptide repeat-containing protein At3g24000, mitochondrial-like [Miscanthus floridulus]|uniref:pentatricopeptide repeat-containing protein At3g24000, mitochondrial-like n=1 Tax=Miscanthus floridulus TaxID=154761 RepID=UPI0034596990